MQTAISLVYILSVKVTSYHWQLTSSRTYGTIYLRRNQKPIREQLFVCIMMILQSEEQGGIIGSQVVRRAVLQAIKKWKEGSDD